MKTAWMKAREDVFNSLEGTLKKLKLKVKTGDLDNSIEEPPSAKMGDLACSISFQLGRQKKVSPRDIAEKILANTKKPSIAKKVGLAGAYVNFFLNRGAFAKEVIKETFEKDYSRAEKRKEKIMVEFSQANTHKAFHIGHLRGTLLGESLSRILEYNGYEVLRANYQGDIGAHVAKCLWAYQTFHRGDTPNSNRGEWLGRIYAEASKKLEESPEHKAEVEKLQKKLEEGKDSELMDLWKRTRQWSLDEYEEIYKDLGVKFNYYFFESQMDKRGKDLVQELQKKKIAKKSAGAVVVELKKYDLDTFLLLKSDGTTLYSTRDLALAEEKFKKYKIDRTIIVTGSEQRLYFQQLFKTLELMGFKQVKKSFNLTFDLITLQGEKMSSREGLTITYRELKEKMFQKALAEVTSRNPELPLEGQKNTAMQIAIGAIKFSILNISNTKTIFFDWDRALEFEGETGPYIQYAAVRAKRILEKAESIKLSEVKFNLLEQEEEHELVKHLAKFPLIIQETATHYRVHTLANYAHKLAEKFNLFYNNLPVLNAPDKDLINARVAVVQATFNVLKNCLYLLGIEIPERM
ncbi:TPA: arginine--tRNA ligase [archaeon]|uniref:Arginine--tRNA ligase n=1 Tax=Candidatus Naiadarchaeum limnaeum TaxID=2756139 RepID=A0A832XLW5_9ARCH|nr:arginine--tRNA ligase [Candidatus Naiadarchaeum limnaeum]